MNSEKLRRPTIVVPARNKNGGIIWVEQRSNGLGDAADTMETLEQKRQLGNSLGAQSEKLKRPPTVVPVRLANGEIAWHPIRRSRSLGQADEEGGSTMSTLSTVQSAINVASTVQNASGAKPTNETLNKVSAIAATAASLTVAVPVVAAAFAIVAGAARILSGIVGNSDIDAEVQRIRNTNDDLYSQIQSLDDQIRKVTNVLSQMNAELKTSGLPFASLSGVNGLGSDLESEQSMNTSLQKQLQQKALQLQQLIETYVSTVKQIDSSLRFKKIGQTIVLVGLGAIALGGLTWFLVRDVENKEK